MNTHTFTHTHHANVTHTTLGTILAFSLGYILLLILLPLSLKDSVYQSLLPLTASWHASGGDHC